MINERHSGIPITEQCCQMVLPFGAKFLKILGPNGAKWGQILENPRKWQTLLNKPKSFTTLIFGASLNFLGPGPNLADLGRKSPNLATLFRALSA